jgi:hypothetical protein
MNEVCSNIITPLRPLHCHSIGELLSKEHISIVHFNFCVLVHLYFITSFNYREDHVKLHVKIKIGICWNMEKLKFEFQICNDKETRFELKIVRELLKNVMFVYPCVSRYINLRPWLYIRCPITLKWLLLRYRVIYTMLALYQSGRLTHNYTYVLIIDILY